MFYFCQKCRKNGATALNTDKVYEKYPELENLAQETQHAWSPGFFSF